MTVWKLREDSYGDNKLVLTVMRKVNSERDIKNTERIKEDRIIREDVE